MGSVHCRSDATRELRELMSTGVEFHQNVRNVLYCAALRSGNENDFYFVWDRMLSTDDATGRNLLISALGCSSTTRLLRVLLRSTLETTNDNDIEYRPGEAYRVFSTVYQNGLIGLDLALDFVTDNAQDVFDEFGFTNFENIIIGKWICAVSFFSILKFPFCKHRCAGMSQRVTLWMRGKVNHDRLSQFCQCVKFFLKTF